MDKRHSNIRQKLLSENDIDLDKMVTIYKSMELSSVNNYYLEKEQVQQVMAVRSSQIQQARNMKNTFDHTRALNINMPRNQSRFPQRQSTCMRCGQIHNYRCPAYGVQCNKCSKIGHFSKLCRTPINNIETDEYHNARGPGLFTAQVSSDS
ncbi:uncharacterized protein [Choristoneura fumiferana]